MQAPAQPRAPATKASTWRRGDPAEWHYGRADARVTTSPTGVLSLRVGWGGVGQGKVWWYGSGEAMRSTGRERVWMRIGRGSCELVLLASCSGSANTIISENTRGLNFQPKSTRSLSCPRASQQPAASEMLARLHRAHLKPLGYVHQTALGVL